VVGACGAALRSLVICAIDVVVTERREREMEDRKDRGRDEREHESMQHFT
jgi:hypothetical protein